jgi:DNA-binding CsgD family transcriptional regulator
MNTARFSVGEGRRARFVLHVSNYHHRRGGMWKSIKLGTPSQVSLLDTHETTYDLLLLGSFIALGLFNLFLFWTNREAASKNARGIAVPALLSVAFFALVVRVMVTGQILTTQLIPSFPWNLQLRLEYLSAMVVLISFAWICERSYPGVVPRWVIWFITGFVAVNAFIALFFPVIVYSRVVTSYNVIKSITLLGMTVRFIIWAAKGHKESWAMVGAILIFFLITFGETLHYREVILSRDFAPVGFIVSLIGTRGANETLVYLASTLGTLGVMLVVFNLFVLKVSLAFLKHEERLTPLDLGSLQREYGVTERELEILQLVAVGKSNKEIAHMLYISEGTVKNHLYRVMRKLDVGNRTEIAVRLTGQMTG